MRRVAALQVIACALLLLGACSRQGAGPDTTAPSDAAAPAVATEAGPAAPIDIVGVWQPDDTEEALQIVGDRPALTPAGRRLLNARHAAAARGDRGWDGTLRCLPPGTPRILLVAQPLDISIDAHLVAMTFQYQRLVRMIYLDDAYPTSADATFMGQSRGRWDGNALVVETGNFKTGTALDGTGLPHGAGLALTERFERVADDTLVDHITVNDPEMYQRAWQAQVTLRRRPDLRVREDVCVERTGLHP